MLSELLLYQDASLSIAPSQDRVYLVGTLTINVKGTTHTFKVGRFTVSDVLKSLTHQFLQYRWSQDEERVVDVRGGVAEVVQGDVTILNWDALDDSCCPRCLEELAGSRTCLNCGFEWTEEDE